MDSTLLQTGFIPAIPLPLKLYVLGQPPPTARATRQRPARGDSVEPTITATTTVPEDNVQRPKAQYKVYRTYHRLIGAPRFTPPLHTRVQAVPIAPNKVGRHAMSYDIIPQHPTKLATLLALISGQCVPAVVRIRKVHWPLRNCAAFVVDCGEAVVDESVVSAWVHSYSGCACHENSVGHSCVVGLSLYQNNCWTFANDVARIMLGHATCSR